MMDWEIQEVSSQEKAALKLFLMAHLEEVSQYAEVDRDEMGQIVYPYFELYWTEEKRKALWIKGQGKNIGFVLLNDFVLDQAFAADRSIAEFYLQPAFRRKGIGRQVAFHIFRTYRGKWEVRHDVKNETARLFWTDIIRSFSQGRFLEKESQTADYQVRLHLFESGD